MEGLEHRHLAPGLGEVRRAGHAGRPGADDPDLEAARLDMRDVGPLLLDGVVADPAFQTADGDWFERLADHADALALRLLRTDAAAHRGQQIAGGDDVIGAAEILGADRFDEFRDIDIDRTAGDAGRVGAQQTAFRLVLRLFQRIAAIDFFEILHPQLRILFAYGSPLLRNAADGLFLLRHDANSV